MISAVGNSNTMLKKLLSIYGALCLAVLTFIVQQALTFFFAVRKIIPFGTAERNVPVRHGKVIFDGDRAVSLLELPIAGSALCKYRSSH